MAITKRRRPHARAHTNKKKKTHRKKQDKKRTRKQKEKKRKRTRKQKIYIEPPIVYGRIHATWCGHCTAMEPAWKQIEEQNKLKPSGPARFDIESEELDNKKNEFAQTYQSTLTHNGYPTIYKLYEKGGPVEYYESGDRSEPAIRKWLFSRPKQKI